MQRFSLHTVDLGAFDVDGVAADQKPEFHIVMQRQDGGALIEGRSGQPADGFNHSIFFSCYSTEQQLRDLEDLLKRNDGTVVRMKPANLEIHSGGRPITFRCQPGELNLRLLSIGSSGARDHEHVITLKDHWDRKLPHSQAVMYFAKRLDDLLNDF